MSQNVSYMLAMLFCDNELQEGGEPENITVRACRIWKVCKDLGMDFPGPDEEAVNELSSLLLA